MNTTAAPLASLATAYQVAYLIYAQGGDAVAFIRAMDALIIAEGLAPTNEQEVVDLIRHAWWPIIRFNEQAA